MENRIDMDYLEGEMLSFGFRERYRGTDYLRRAVVEWRPGMGMTKELYPRIAKQCGTTPGAVERGMRWALGEAFCRADPVETEIVFGRGLEPGKAPTIGEFVARMARVCCAN